MRKFNHHYSTPVQAWILADFALKKDPKYYKLRSQKHESTQVMEVLSINNNLHQRIVLIMERDNMINNYYICALNNVLQAGTDLKQEN